jgi:hypothetical protein
LCATSSAGCTERYRIRSIASRIVIPENASAFIRDRKKTRPEFVKIPDTALGGSGMTPPAGEAIERIWYETGPNRFS